MVIAHALLGFTEFHKESVAVLRSADQTWAPDLLRAELLSTLWQWTRAREMPIDITLDLLQDGEGLIRSYVPVQDLWGDALRLSMARNHSPYDTLFVALAARLGVKVVTYDGPLMKKFPEWTISVPDFLAGDRPTQ